jgi:3-hydroxyacyl-[acyl-carrier-protein] dehydratase
MQIVREILEDSLQRELRIVGGDNLKFLSIINPEQNPQVDVSVNYTSSGNQWMVNAALSAGTVTFFKFKGTLQNT